MNRICNSHRPAVRRVATWTAASVGLLSATFSRGGLTIVPTWDSTITSDPNGAAIEASINSAIAVYAADFSDNVTETITFKEMSSGLGQSNWYYYNESYSSYIAALQSHKTSATDNTVLAHLSSGSTNPVNGASTIRLQGPNARALGYSAPTPTGQTDGTVSLNTSLMNLSAPFNQNGSKYSLFAVVSHEIDECLGFASALNGLSNGAAAPTTYIWPEDLFRYDSAGNRSFNTTASTAAYFSIDGAAEPVRFNQQAGGDFSDWYSYFGGVTPRVQDAFSTSGAAPSLGLELTALDAIGYTPAVTAPVSLTWDPSTAAGLQDGGGTWSTTLANFSDGTTNYPWTNGTTLNATFGVGNGAAGIVTLGEAITAQTLAFNAASAGTYTIAGTFTLTLIAGATITTNANATITAPISAAAGLTKNGPATLNLAGNTTVAGTATVAAGTLTLGGGSFTAASVVVQTGATFNWSAGAFSAPLTINAGGVANLLANTGAGILPRSMNTVTLASGTTAQLNVLPAANHANRQFVIAGGLTLAGSTNAWQGQVDLANNDLDIQNGSLSAVTNQIATGYASGAWTGNGIISSIAKSDPSHLTTLGVILNGATYSSFDNQPVAAADVIVKYTYFGDANLDGKVDGSDYSKLDSGFLTNATGWQNGDFNYDGVVNASDYTLIDNAFNRQSVNLQSAALVADPDGLIAPVPEPTSVGLIAASIVIGARPRHRRHD